MFTASDRRAFVLTTLTRGQNDASTFQDIIAELGSSPTPIAAIPRALTVSPPTGEDNLDDFLTRVGSAGLFASRLELEALVVRALRNGRSISPSSWETLLTAALAGPSYTLNQIERGVQLEVVGFILRLLLLPSAGRPSLVEFCRAHVAGLIGKIANELVVRDAATVSNMTAILVPECPAMFTAPANRRFALAILTLGQRQSGGFQEIIAELSAVSS